MQNMHANFLLLKATPHQGLSVGHYRVLHHTISVDWTSLRSPLFCRYIIVEYSHLTGSVFNFGLLLDGHKFSCISWMKTEVTLQAAALQSRVLEKQSAVLMEH